MNEKTPDIDKMEIYVRFASPEYGTGVHETPSSSFRDAAMEFVADDDCVSAMRVGVSSDGRAVAMSDVTDKVIEELTEMIRDDPEAFPSCPHPAVEEVHREILEEAERVAEEEREHERIERAMLQI